MGIKNLIPLFLGIKIFDPRAVSLISPRFAVFFRIRLFFAGIKFFGAAKIGIKIGSPGAKLKLFQAFFLIPAVVSCGRGGPREVEENHGWYHILAVCARPISELVPRSGS